MLPSLMDCYFKSEVLTVYNSYVIKGLFRFFYFVASLNNKKSAKEAGLGLIFRWKKQK